MLKAYLDGSGKFEDRNSRFLTLAAAFADDNQWENVESAWGRVLDGEHVGYSHMKELLRGDGPFQGWDDDRKKDFVRALFLSLHNHPDLRFASVTVDLTEYRALRTGKRRIKPATAVCVDFCMTHVFGHPEFHKGKAEILFDRGESFMRTLKRVWERGKNSVSGWPAYVSMVAPVDGMKKVRPIQMADLIAWSANRSHEGAPNDYWRSNHMRSVFGLDHSHAFYGRSELMDHPGFYDWREIGATLTE